MDDYYPRFISLRVIIEKTDDNYSAYSPNLPGCVASGETFEEANQNMLEAVKLRVEGALANGLPSPVQRSRGLEQVFIDRIEGIS